MGERASYLLILGDREAVAWVLSEERMAFSRNRAASARELIRGDRLLLYTTRGAFHNPTRDRGRVIGVASVASEVEELDQPIRVAGREFEFGCDLVIESLARLGEGIQLAPLVQQLRVFPQPAAWSAQMRRPLLRLPTADARLLLRDLDRVAGPVDEALEGYLAAARLSVA